MPGDSSGLHGRVTDHRVSQSPCSDSSVQRHRAKGKVGQQPHCPTACHRWSSTSSLYRQDRTQTAPNTLPVSVSLTPPPSSPLERSPRSQHTMPRNPDPEIPGNFKQGVGRAGSAAASPCQLPPEPAAVGSRQSATPSPGGLQIGGP